MYVSFPTRNNRMLVCVTHGQTRTLAHEYFEHTHVRHTQHIHAYIMTTHAY